MSMLAAIALGVGLLTSVGLLTQAHRIARGRSPEDVSLVWLDGAGCLVWLGFGVTIGSAPLVAVGMAHSLASADAAPARAQVETSRLEAARCPSTRPRHPYPTP